MMHKHCKEIIAWARGAVIQYKAGNKWEDVLDNKPTWNEKDIYRVKPAYEDWQLDLIQAVKDGKKVEALVNGIWIPASVLDRLVRHDEVAEYEWYPEDKYRVKDEPKYVWTYESNNGNWYLSSLVCSVAQAKKYFESAGVKNYKKLEVVK